MESPQGVAELGALGYEYRMDEYGQLVEQPSPATLFWSTRERRCLVGRTVWAGFCAHQWLEVTAAMVDSVELIKDAEIPRRTLLFDHGANYPQATHFGLKLLSV